MSKIGKALLSTAMIAATAATFASTTYAFVVLEDQVNVEDFEVNISTQKGLLVSLDSADGTPIEGPQDPNPSKRNFYQDIPLSQVKAAVKAATGKDYAEVKYSGVTIMQDKSTDYTVATVAPAFFKDSIVPAQDTLTDYKGKHEFTAAAKDDYLKLDFTFRLAHQGDITDDYELFFYNSAITNKKGPADVTIVNQLTDQTKTHASGEKITVDPANAMRVATYNATEQIFNVVEPTNENDLGSAAIEGNGEAKHDKTKNAMYTYHNSVHPLDPFTTAASNTNISLKTNATFDATPKLGTFTYAKESKSYNDISLSVYVYLEGWDADYFMGIPFDAQSFNIKLGFQIKPVVKAVE